MARSGLLMFQDVHVTWNPVTGCLHECVYCWSRRMAERLRAIGAKKYSRGFAPTLHPKEFRRSFRAGELVFVCDMGDLFGAWVPEEWILRVLSFIADWPGTTFLLLTKNPRRYLDFIDELGRLDNVLLGATIETDDAERYEAWRVSKAPNVDDRLEAMRELRSMGFSNLMVSIEPVLDFNLDSFTEALVEIRPRLVYIGYDNYNCGLPEPPLDKTLRLVARLRGAGIDAKAKGKKLLAVLAQ